MKHDLEPSKTILRKFISDLESVQKLCCSVDGPQFITAFSVKDCSPIFDDHACSKTTFSEIEEEAYQWLYFDAWHPRAMMHRPKINPLPDYYHQLAIHLYEEWLELNRNIIDRGEIIPEPMEDCSLITYLRLLETKIINGCENRVVWMSSLKSFLQYLREDIPHKNMLGWLDSIFPYKMEIREHWVSERTENGVEKVKRQVILRNILPAVYPIDIQATSNIIKNLFKNSLEGRSNSQHSAAEALGFAWVCHAAAATQIMVEEQDLFEIKITDLIPPEPGMEKQWFKPEYYLRISSKNGFVNVPISKNLYMYLLALPRQSNSEYIFCLPWRTLYRTLLNKGVRRRLNSGSHMNDNISFLTLMSQPHYAIGYRYTQARSSF